MNTIPGLIKVVDAATPGPWRVSRYGAFVSSDGLPPCADTICSVVNCDGDAWANQRFIAAFNPDLVRKLLEVAKAAEEAKDAMYGDLNYTTRYVCARGSLADALSQLTTNAQLERNTLPLNTKAQP